MFKVVIIWGGREYLIDLIKGLIKNIATVLKGKLKSMIIFKNNLDYIAVIIKYIGFHF